MSSFKVLNPGMLTLIQDKGRLGYQQYGVPVSGVMDDFAYEVGNMLVGNDDNEACLEVTMIGPKLKFDSSSIIAITGADINPMINGRPIPMWRSYLVKKGDELSFGSLKSGLRSYITFYGGIKTAPVMESRSTYMKANIGGFDGRQLKVNDEIPIGEYEETNSLDMIKYLKANKIPSYKNELALRVVLGPQNDMFTKEGLETFLSSQYQITGSSDRMGYQLDGNQIEHINGSDIISDGIVMGSIQVPGSGKPIIMMA